MITISDVVKILRESKLNLTVKDNKIYFTHYKLKFEIEKFNENFSLSIDGYMKEFDRVQYTKFEDVDKILFYLDYYAVEAINIWN